MNKEEVMFRKKSSFQKDNRLFCKRKANLEAVYGDTLIRCCDDQTCKELAAKEAKKTGKAFAKDNPNQPRKKKLAELLNDNETREKILKLIDLRQRERFLHIEGLKLTEEITKIQTEIEVKHQLTFPESIMLQIIAQDAEYKHLFKKYNEDYK